MNFLDWAKNEIEIASKREDEYGKSIYNNVLECLEQICPLIENAGHTGFSYSQFVRILKRLLDRKILTPITEDDFKNKMIMPHGVVEDDVRDDGTIVRQCNRYSSLFRSIKPDGTIEYDDVNRIVVVDQHDLTWHSGFTERQCKDLIPSIKLPYLPNDKPIRIYSYQFTTKEDGTFTVERGTYNSEYIRTIKMPDGKIIVVDKVFIDDKEVKFDQIKMNHLIQTIAKDRIDFIEECKKLKEDD